MNKIETCKSTQKYCSCENKIKNQRAEGNSKFKQVNNDKKWGGNKC